MDSRVIVLLLVAAVFNGVSSSEGNSWSLVISESGKLERLDPSQVVAESRSTESELKAAVIFHLFTKSNPETSETIYLNDDNALSASNFNPKLPTRFIIHGWQSHVEKPIVTLIRDAYFVHGDYNVIAIDWSKYAGLGYIYARTKIVTVGEYIGQMIDYLEGKGMNVDDLIVIGHSLGAHVAGVACRTATNTVGSIIASDPAGPLFYALVVDGRLRPTDAAFVQVVHTSAGKLGYLGNLGDVDFWPNGGTVQAGCFFDIFGDCSHKRSYYFIAESIAANSPIFIAYKCKDYSSYSSGSCSSNDSTYLGGLILDKNASGEYYLETNKESPYAKG